MTDGIWSALSGAAAQITVMDVAANNVANASTPGFHADQAIFREHLTNAGNKNNQNLRYTAIDTIATDVTPGEVSPTDKPSDVAIRGAGFFTVNTAQGERYTRLGSVQGSKDGTLVTRDGDTFVGSDHKPLRAPQGASIEVTADGTVRANGASVGQLLTVSFANPGALEKEGPLTFRATQGSGPAKVGPVELEPRALELSNVSAVKGMVEVVTASRSFDACERAIDAFRDADRRAMTLMGHE